MGFIIIKHIYGERSRLPVVLLDGLGEVMEFSTEEQANEMASLFQMNTDSGHVYEVKKIGKNV